MNGTDPGKSSTEQPQHFQATIGKQGPNPYVDVPERVSVAFAHHARGGRVSVEGRLNGTFIRTTLVPVGRGRHRLYVNGGMRAATGVVVGDTASFELRSTAHADVSVPEDLADALDGADGAREAFEAMSPSHAASMLPPTVSSRMCGGEPPA